MATVNATNTMKPQNNPPHKITITPIPAEAARFILNLAFKSGINLENSEARIEPSAYEFALIITLDDQTNTKADPLLFLVNRPWSGISYNPNNGIITPVTNSCHREVTTWLNLNYPPANRPLVKYNEARMLVGLVNSRLQNWCKGDNDTDWIVKSDFGPIWERSALAERMASMSGSDRISLQESIDAYWRFYTNSAADDENLRKLFNLQEGTIA